METKGRNGTSLKEQALFYFVKEYFPSAENRRTFLVQRKKIEVDIYIPELRLVVEYDGGYWHEGKVEKDNQKTELLNKEGYYVLHIREFGLPDLKPFQGHTIELPYVKLNEKNFDYINCTLSFLANYASKNGISITPIVVTEEEYAMALKHIYALRYPNEVTPNLSDMCGIECWDEELNAPLSQKNVGIYEWVPAELRCPNGNSIALPRYSREFKSTCLAKGDRCEKCLQGIMCPLFRYCKKQNGVEISCAYVEAKIWQMIEQRQTLKGLDMKYSFTQWLMNESDIGEKIVRKFESYALRSKKREDIAYFLGMERSVYKAQVKNESFNIRNLF